MKIYVVYWWDRFDHTEHGRRYFLSQEKAMAYSNNSNNNNYTPTKTFMSHPLQSN